MADANSSCWGVLTTGVGFVHSGLGPLRSASLGLRRSELLPRAVCALGSGFVTQLVPAVETGIATSRRKIVPNEGASSRFVAVSLASRGASSHGTIKDLTSGWRRVLARQEQTLRRLTPRAVSLPRCAGEPTSG
jgi:hypothetical protein